ncbi:UNVERIFIED_CONTAM: putative mitochondrial protein, partial [Sesamum radiatum]
YAETSYALRFLVIKSEISGIEDNTIVEFRDAVFIEDVFPMKTGIPSSVSLDDSLASTSIPEHMEKNTNVEVNPSSTSLTYEELDEPRRSKRARDVKDFESDFVTYNIEDDPTTFKDAMASSEAKQWKEAVKSEMDSIVSNGTWKLVDLSPRCTTIGCKWIFKKKLKSDGSVDKFKAILVAKVSSKWHETIYISFSASKLARYTSCPDKTHRSALDRVLRWGAVSWKSAKQTLITRSTFEAELCALDTTGTEAEWLFGLLSQLPILSQPLPPIAVYCDSQTTIAKLRSRKYNQKTKQHI